MDQGPGSGASEFNLGATRALEACARQLFDSNNPWSNLHCPSAEPSLTAQTLELVRSEFVENGHHPSQEQWGALEELALTLAALADGTADPSLYLSSLDPGVGKSTVLRCFLRALIESREHKDIGVLICMPEIKEVQKLVESVGELANRVHVWTSNDEANGRGQCGFVDQAQVLVTTHSRMIIELRGRTLGETSSLFFRGAPRLFRVWDEAFLPGEVLTVSVDDVLETLRYLRLYDPELRSWVKEHSDRIDQVSEECPFLVPVLIDDDQLESLKCQLAGQRHLSDAHRRRLELTLSTLHKLGLETTRIVRDGWSGNTMVHWERVFPKDLAPLVVLDASGRLRHTYSELEKQGQLRRLKSAAKSYDNLSVYHWDVGGGRLSIEKRMAAIVEGVAVMVRSHLNEEWLIIHSKHHDGGSPHYDLPKLLSEQFSDSERPSIRYMTWGRHTSTNEFCNIRNVILVGTHFLPMSQYQGLTRLCAELSADEPVEKAALDDFRQGEHANHILQAACRGIVRRSEGSGCSEARLYVIGSPRSGITKSLLERIFPLCRVRSFVPDVGRLRGKIGEALAWLKHWAAGARVADTVSFREVAKALGLNATQFKKLVKERPAFKASLQTLGLETWAPRGGRATQFIKLPSAKV